MKKAVNRAVCAVSSMLILHSAAFGELAADAYLKPQLRTGETFTNVFSRTIAFRAAGWDDSVSRISGTGVYTVTDVAGDHLVFDGTFLYDGRAESKGKVEVRDRGRISCWEGHCIKATDASGLLYNAGLWGDPKGHLRKGTTWIVDLQEPWELGSAGQQRITVVSLNPKERVIVLKREGGGAGFFANDKKEIKLARNGKAHTVSVTPGPSHWSGYATFRAGIVVSDELVVERPVTLTNNEAGNFPGTEREYILLNLAPNGSV